MGRADASLNMEWDWEAVRKELQAMAEPDYRAFASGLIPGGTPMLGVRLPALRGLSKRIARGDWRAFFRAEKGKCFEETLLRGMVIGYAKAGVDELLAYTASFVPEIGDWSTCDSFCDTLKFVRKDPERVWAFLQPYFPSEREFDVRFGVVMLLDHFIQEAFIDRVLETLDNVRHTGYYAQMAVAWALAECYARFPERTMAYLPNSRLDTFPFNKALQKMIESRRICGEEKERLRAMKRR